MTISQKIKFICSVAIISAMAIYPFNSGVKANNLESTQVESEISESAKDIKNFVVDKNGRLSDYLGSSKFVVIPENVKVIGKYAFSGHNEIKSVIFPKGLVRIECYAFSNCMGLNKVNIPDSVKIINRFAFSACTSLEKIRFGKGVKKIGGMCLGFCSSLKSIEVDEDNAFFASRDGVLYDKTFDTLIRCPEAMKGEFIVPSNVKKVNKYSFSDCKHLEKITFNEELEKIDEVALFGCVSLKEVIFGNNLKSIDRGAFLGCELLDNICLPQTVGYIGDSAFYGCKSLKDITIKSRNVELGNHVFKGCCNALEIKIPTGSSVNEYAENKNLKVRLMEE